MIAKLKCPILKKQVEVWKECSDRDCKYLIAAINSTTYYRIGNTKRKRRIKTEWTKPIVYKCGKVKE